MYYYGTPTGWWNNATPSYTYTTAYTTTTDPLPQEPVTETLYPGAFYGFKWLRITNRGWVSPQQRIPWRRTPRGWELDAECQAFPHPTWRWQTFPRRAPVESNQFPLGSPRLSKLIGAHLAGFPHPNVVLPAGQEWRLVCVREPLHEAPQRGCSCGIYAAASPDYEQLNNYYYADAALVALKLWGRIVRHSHGFRAQHARIERAFRVKQLQLRRRNQGVPTTWGRNPEQLYDLAQAWLDAQA